MSASDVYAAEELWMGKEIKARVRFGDWDDIWPFYRSIAQAYTASGRGVIPPDVKPRRGALKAHYDRITRTVYVPPYAKGGSWALKTGVAIHEFVHHLTPGEGHGVVFRQEMVNCLRVLGWDECATVLEDCYAQCGLGTDPEAETATDKVAKILSHADGAANDQERMAFLEGAQRIATKHSIDLALIRKINADKTDRDRPATSGHYSVLAISNVTRRKLAVSLVSHIANAHGLRCIIHGNSAHLSFLGFPEDIELTELMSDRIVPMMFEEADKYLSSPEHKSSGVSAVSARIAFCQAFTQSVSTRLQDAVKVTEKEASKDPGTEIALREKAVEVADYAAYEFKRRGVQGHWSGSSTNSRSWSASNAGRSAGNNADLHGRKALR